MSFQVIIPTISCKWVYMVSLTVYPVIQHHMKRVTITDYQVQSVPEVDLLSSLEIHSCPQKGKSEETERGAVKIIGSSTAEWTLSSNPRWKGEREREVTSCRMPMAKGQNTSCSDYQFKSSTQICRSVPYGIQDSSGSKQTWVKEDNNKRGDVWLLWVTVGLLVKYLPFVEIYMGRFSPTMSTIYLNHPKHKALVITH